MNMIDFTHKGWFGMCPVYLSDILGESPIIDARHWLFVPLMYVSEWGFAAAFWCAEQMSDSFVPMFPLRITGKLARPISRRGKEFDQ